MKKASSLMLAIVMALILTLSPIALAEQAFTAGTYTAEAAGMMGNVAVQVELTADAIASVTVLEQSETESIAGPALSRIPAAIVENQTLAVDAVAGATMTSNAILDAVRQCIVQAGGDIDALMVAPEAEETTLTPVALEADVVIIGAGGAGLSAAISALEAGAKVIVVEKMGAVGGTTALSSGFIQVAGTEQQKAYGITEDNWEIYANDIYTRGSELGNKEIIDFICQNANATMDWMGAHGVNWQDTLSERHGEDVTYLRTHAPIAPEGFTGALGAVLTDTLSAEAAEMGASIMLDTKAHTIIREGDAVTGIVAVNAPENTEYTITAKSVIVATGGFAANSEMAHKYTPSFPADNTDFRAFPGSLGEGIEMGEAVGAALTHMEHMKILVSSAGNTTSVTNAIYVNENGDRFVAEDSHTEVLAAAINEQPASHCFMVYDSRTVGEVTDAITAMIDAGDLTVADTLDELAGKLGIDAAHLNASVEAFNAVVSGEGTDAFGRTTFGNTIEEGPFYAAERHTRLHYTNGGLAIDVNTHVFDNEGAVIPGLYAAGETTGGIHGSYRVGANALSEIFVMGRAAGTIAATEALAE